MWLSRSCGYLLPFLVCWKMCGFCLWSWTRRTQDADWVRKPCSSAITFASFSPDGPSGEHQEVEHSSEFASKKASKTSLVVQWLICLPGLILVQEDPICRKATKPLSHNYWDHILEPASCSYWAHKSQLPKSSCTRTCDPQQEKHHNEKPTHRNTE